MSLQGNDYELFIPPHLVLEATPDHHVDDDRNFAKSGNNSAPSSPMKKSRSLDMGKLNRLSLNENYHIRGDEQPSLSRLNHQTNRPWRSSHGSLLELKDIMMADQNDADCSCIKHPLRRRPSISQTVATSTVELSEESFLMRMVGDRRRWTVGRVSMLMLLLVTFTDLALNVVNAQMETLESPDYYDALSAEVIRPAFRYHSTKGDKHAERPRLALGAAAISSVTTTLSPILPFTGGLDLRREDYWVNGWFGSVSSVFQQVRDAFAAGAPSLDKPATSKPEAIPRGGSKVAARSKTRGSNKSPRPLALSDPTPFVPYSEIGDMTLDDLSAVYHYALESTREDFNSAKFSHGMLPRMKNVLGAVSDAVAKSRGKGILSARTGGNRDTAMETGNIDALHFCAAMRIFAEWRVLRQVPEGYKGYAVGMSLGQKDVIQNVAKIEQAVHQYIDDKTDALADYGDDCETEIRSPTLRQLLTHEIETNVHDNSKLPRLKERSGAMGLLWVKRQLQYQTSLFANVVQVPKVFESSNAAISAAYVEVYGKLHGWAVQKIFNYSFQAAPHPDEIYKIMNPHRFKEVMATALADISHGDHPIPSHLDLDDDGDMNPFEKFGRHVGNEWDKLGRHVGHEWDKFAGSVVRIFNPDQLPSMDGGMLPPGVELTESQEMEIEQFVVNEMKNDAHQKIHSYLDVVQPLLRDLDGLFDELNMDDPTRV